jgi:hypothetical protein
VVGTANWGPVNSPVVFGDLAGASAAFGAMQNRKYDLLTQVALATLQGANNFVGVRVTDGTDVAATATDPDELPHADGQVHRQPRQPADGVIGTGTAPSSLQGDALLPGLAPETFDNITGSPATRSG